MAGLVKNPPPNAARETHALAATGFSKKGIAAHFCVSQHTFDRWLDEDPNLQAAFEFGREAERQALHNVLYKLAVEENDKVAAMFLLKARHGYREGDQSEQSNRVSITFALPGAMKPEEYKVLDADTGASVKQLPEPIACDTRRI